MATSRSLRYPRDAQSVCMALDYIDELGTLGSGRHVEMDLHWLECVMPPGALTIAWSTVFGRSRCTIRYRKAGQVAFFHDTALDDDSSVLAREFKDYADRFLSDKRTSADEATADSLFSEVVTLELIRHQRPPLSVATPAGCTCVIL